jgi:tRNA modification GTPase
MLLSMNSPSYGDRDPIAAVATVPGESALTLIRASGEGSLELLAKAFSRPEKLRGAGGNTVVHGWILGAGGERIDDALVSVYRGPATFTGEDGADISCHGGAATAKAVMEALGKAGFREALRGEFSFRAFMNGKLDLTRAESIMEIVAAKTGRAREGAVRRLSGALEKEIRDINALIVQALAAAELYLDYSEEDGVGGDEAEGLLPDRRLAEEALGRLKALADSYRRERLYAQGALAVIAGRPNAGKSSLFNALLREDRAIVTDIPGTTRDWIEAWVSVEGIPLRLADTAGLHPSEDPVEKLGMERSRELLAAADIILYVLDGARGIGEEDRAFLSAHGEDRPPTLALWNKADLAPPPPGFRPVSATTGEGIEELAGEIAAVLEQTLGGGEAGPGNAAGAGTERQKALIDRARGALEEALSLADRREPLDLIAPALREAVNALGEITGEVSTAELLDAMFSRFCVGK